MHLEREYWNRSSHTICNVFPARGGGVWVTLRFSGVQDSRPPSCLWALTPNFRSNRWLPIEYKSSALPIHSAGGYDRIPAIWALSLDTSTWSEAIPNLLGPYHASSRERCALGESSKQVIRLCSEWNRFIAQRNAGGKPCLVAYIQVN